MRDSDVETRLETRDEAHNMILNSVTSSTGSSSSLTLGKSRSKFVIVDN